MRAATCREVLYDPLPIPDPQVEELCCRLSSSARNNVVGISGHAVGYMNQIGVPACDTEYLNKGEGGGGGFGGGNLRMSLARSDSGDSISSLGEPRWGWQ